MGRRYYGEMWRKFRETGLRRFHHRRSPGEANSFLIVEDQISCRVHSSRRAGCMMASLRYTCCDATHAVLGKCRQTSLVLYSVCIRDLHKRVSPQSGFCGHFILLPRNKLLYPVICRRALWLWKVKLLFTYENVWNHEAVMPSSKNQCQGPMAHSCLQIRDTVTPETTSSNGSLVPKCPEAPPQINASCPRPGSCALAG